MLSRQEEQRIAAAIHLARNRLIPFIRMNDPEYITGHVHRVLADYLEKVERGEIRRLIINTPPRVGKTRLVAIEYPAFALGRTPSKQIVVASYGAGLSYDASKATRLQLSLPPYRQIFPETLLADRAVNNWGTTKRGKYRAVGVSGTLTGRGGDLIVIDDPHKDHEEAHSPVMRGRVWDWFKSTVYTRQSTKAAIIIIMTRWHEDDLVGRLLKEQPEEWHVLKLPAIAKENDPLGRAPGAALFPERYPLEMLENFRKTLGTYMWSALYDQEPVPEGGNQIQVGNLQKIRRDQLPKYLQWCRFWDLAESERKTADETASCKCAMDSDDNLYIADMLSGQWAWGKARNIIYRTAMAEGQYIRVGIETNGGFGTAYENLKEVMPADVPLREYVQDKMKLVRALPWIALTEAKKVFLVECDEVYERLARNAGYTEVRDWHPDFKSQAAAFPNGQHDDKVDGVSGGYQMCKESQGGAEKVTPAEDEDSDIGFGASSRRNIL